MSERYSEPASKNELNEALQRLLRSAIQNGVEIEGGWVVESDRDDQQWDVHVTGVKR